VLEKDGEDQLDRWFEKCSRNVTKDPALGVLTVTDVSKDPALGVLKLLTFRRILL
jgi:hypothetical protein